MSDPPRRRRTLFGWGSWPETRRITQILSKETLGGALLLAGAAAGMVWANTPWSAAYETVRGYTVGPEALHLDLNLATWAADGLLAVFFFVAGLELKREFVAGDLRDRAAPRCRSPPRSAVSSSRPGCTCSSTSTPAVPPPRGGPSRPRPTSRSRWRCSP
jgi:NhaA family Na+:H+ antiporter